MNRNMCNGADYNDGRGYCTSRDTRSNYSYSSYNDMQSNYSYPSHEDMQSDNSHPLHEDNQSNNSQPMHQQKSPNGKEQNLTILVKNGSPEIKISEYRKFFTMFGKVDNVYPKARQAILVMFKSSEVTDVVMQASDNLYLKGCKLEISRSRFNPRKKKKKISMAALIENEDGIETGKLPKVFQLSFTGDFHSQLCTLMSHIRMKPSNLQNMDVVCAHLAEVLNSKYPGCRIISFGSVTNGRALVDSNLDCFAEITEQNKHNLKMSHIGETENNTLLRLMVNLFDHNKIFTKLEETNPTLPYIRLRHNPTGIILKFNFLSSTKVSSSDVIEFLIATDKQLSPVFTFLNYWAKCHDLIAGVKGLSSYILNVLIIFYLQRLPQPVLPPIHFLQQDSEAYISRDGWNCGFNRNLRSIPQHYNQSDILTLIAGFFDYYKSFSFQSVMISPFTGLAIENTYFANIDQLPPELSSYVNFVKIFPDKGFNFNTNINIQDLFKLNENIAIRMRLKRLTYFQNACEDALHTINMARSDNTLRGLIIALMDSKVRSTPFLFEVPMSAIWKQMNLQKQQAYKHIKIIVEFILKEVLRCNFTCSKTFTEESKQLSVTKYVCKAHFDFWSHRKEYKDHFKNVPNLKYEVMVSTKILDAFYKNVKPKKPLHNFILSIIPNNVNFKYQVEIVSDNNQYTKNFKMMASLFGDLFLTQAVRKMSEILPSSEGFLNSEDVQSDKTVSNCVKGSKSILHDRPFIFISKMRPSFKNMKSFMRIVKSEKHLQVVLEFILKEILHCKFTSSAVKRNNNSKSILVTEFVCEPVYNLWSRRKEHRMRIKTHTKKISTLENEAHVSKVILERRYSGRHPTKPQCKFTILAIPDSWQDQYRIEIDSKTAPDFMLESIACFIGDLFIQHVMKTTKELFTTHRNLKNLLMRPETAGESFNITEAAQVQLDITEQDIQTKSEFRDDDFQTGHDRCEESYQTGQDTCIEHYQTDQDTYEENQTGQDAYKENDQTEQDTYEENQTGQGAYEENYQTGQDTYERNYQTEEETYGEDFQTGEDTYEDFQTGQNF